VIRYIDSRETIAMNDQSKEQIASNLVIAFYSAVEPRPSYLGKDKRRKDVPVSGLDMRNPSISPAEVFDVYKKFLNMLEAK